MFEIIIRRGCHNAYDMPTFEKTFETFKYPSKTIFENYIEEKGFIVSEFWHKIDDAIVQIVMNTESNVIKKVNTVSDY